jgi:hypothetical protein
MRLAARVGYAARGVVYAIVGVLALMVALGQGGRTTGTRGALEEVASKPFGSVMLGALGLGLVAFAAWRFAQAVRNTEGYGSDTKGKLGRAALVVSGVIHAGLGLSAFRMLQGRSGSSGGGTQGMTAKLMEAPFGRFLVALVGLVIIGFAVQQLKKVWERKVLRKLDLGGLAAAKRGTVENVSRAGVAARAVVFLMTGGFFLKAALDRSPGEARGLDGALATLARQPAGDLLLGLVALGLICYAAYQLLEARYRRLNVR